MKTTGPDDESRVRAFALRLIAALERQPITLTQWRAAREYDAPLPTIIQNILGLENPPSETETAMLLAFARELATSEQSNQYALPGDPVTPDDF
jgi:hypothetical protein